jgi:hypothetical protein
LVILSNLLLSNNCWSYTNSSSGNNFNPDKFFTSPNLHHKPQGVYMKRAAGLLCFWSLCNMKLEPYSKILGTISPWFLHKLCSIVDITPIFSTKAAI